MKASLFLVFLFVQISVISQSVTNDSLTVKTEYHFTVRLTKALSLPPDCGIFAWALLQKFEVIFTDFPNYYKKFVLLIEPCPEFLGHNFFQTEKIYEVDVAADSGATFGYSYMNDYEKEKLPIFRNKKISKKN